MSLPGLARVEPSWSTMVMARPDVSERLPAVVKALISSKYDPEVRQWVDGLAEVPACDARVDGDGRGKPVSTVKLIVCFLVSLARK